MRVGEAYGTLNLRSESFYYTTGLTLLFLRQALPCCVISRRAAWKRIEIRSIAYSVQLSAGLVRPRYTTSKASSPRFQPPSFLPSSFISHLHPRETESPIFHSLSSRLRLENFETLENRETFLRGRWIIREEARRTTRWPTNRTISSDQRIADPRNVATQRKRGEQRVETAGSPERFPFVREKKEKKNLEQNSCFASRTCEGISIFPPLSISLSRKVE